MLLSVGELPLAFEEVPVRWASLSEGLQVIYERLGAHCSGLLVPICCTPPGLGGAAFPEEGASLAWRGRLRSCLRNERETLREP